MKTLYKVTATSAFQPPIELVTKDLEEAILQKWDWKNQQFLVTFEEITEGENIV